VIGERTVARGRQDGRVRSLGAKRASAGREYDYRRFCTSARKTANLLRHLGVRGGDCVVADDPLPDRCLGLYGTALLGNVVQYGVSDVGDELRALVVPEVELDAYDVGPSTKCVVSPTVIW
jgi:hypothetical protein